MNFDECTLLAGVPNAPTNYNPTASPELARQRQKQVIEKMKKIKLSVISLVISLLPFITLLVSLVTEESTDGLQTGLIVLNIISILSGFGLSPRFLRVYPAGIWLPRRAAQACRAADVDGLGVMQTGKRFRCV